MAQRFFGYSKQQLAVKESIRTDANLQANCFTIGRFGDPKEGIEMSLNRGTDEFRPLQPHILVGGYRIHRDHRDGCVYEKQPEGKAAIMRRAVANWVNPEGKRSFYTLKAPCAEKVATTLVKVSTVLPLAKKIEVNGHELRLFAGVDGGTLVGRDGHELLVDLVEGETVTIFYEEGAVRKFRRQGAKLEELYLGSEDMLIERIQNTWSRLEYAEAIGDAAKRERVISAILSGMADLIHLTTRFDQRGLGQEMRRTLLKDFFLELSPEALELCHRKVTAILHQVDPALVSMLREGSYIKDEQPSAASATVSNIADARLKVEELSAEQREERRVRNIGLSEEQRAVKKARQAGIKAQRQARNTPQPKAQKKEKGKGKKKA